MSWPTSSRDLGVYLHTVFCEHVCPYCDFAVEAVGRLEPELESAYIDLLLRELALALDAPGSALDGRRLATLYFGGGTPSLLSASSVERAGRETSAAAARTSCYWDCSWVGCGAWRSPCCGRRVPLPL